MTKVIVFSADWCTNCVAQKKRLEQAGVEFEVVDVDKDMQKAKQYGVRGLPTTVVLNNGKLLKQFTGLTSVEDITKLQGV